MEDMTKCCDFCDSLIANPNLLTIHVNQCHYDRICEYCKDEFCTQREFVDHLINYHKDINVDAKCKCKF